MIQLAVLLVDPHATSDVGEVWLAEPSFGGDGEIGHSCAEDCLSEGVRGEKAKWVGLRHVGDLSEV